MARVTEHMAVLFADVSDSSSLYRTLGDTAAHDLVNACLTLISEEVVRRNGRIIKTIGDEIMCVFPRADDAVLAASEMQAQVDLKRFGKEPVKIHIGLHYGPVLVEGDDICGYTVNAAAYLSAVAGPEQILTTGAVERALPAELRNCLRPIFRAVLKGSVEESIVFQVLWQRDAADVASGGPGTQDFLPADEGGLLLTHRDQTLRLDFRRRDVTIGCDRECDLVVEEESASRHHAGIRLLRTHFYLFDHSVNGTFVTLQGGEEVHVLHGQLLLEGAGSLTPGRSARDGAAEIITFSRDRRSIYRV